MSHSIQWHLSLRVDQLVLNLHHTGYTILYVYMAYILYIVYVFGLQIKTVQLPLVTNRAK